MAPRTKPESAPEALALIEFSSIGRGVRVLDDVTKKAPVIVHTATPVSSGKYLLVFVGDVGSVEESFKEGVAKGGASVVNKLFLPQVHESVMTAMEQRLEVDPAEVDALAIVEVASLATTVAAADAAAKAATVRILEIRLGQGIGGKGFFTLTGTQSDAEAAVAAAIAVAERETTLIDTEIIPRPTAEMIGNIAGSDWLAQSLPGTRRP